MAPGRGPRQPGRLPADRDSRGLRSSKSVARNPLLRPFTSLGVTGGVTTLSKYGVDPSSPIRAGRPVVTARIGTHERSHDCGHVTGSARVVVNRLSANGEGAAGGHDRSTRETPRARRCVSPVVGSRG